MYIVTFIYYLPSPASASQVVNSAEKLESKDPQKFPESMLSNWEHVFSPISGETPTG